MLVIADDHHVTRTVLLLRLLLLLLLLRLPLLAMTTPGLVVMLASETLKNHLPSSARIVPIGCCWCCFYDLAFIATCFIS
jgi:hypothetical protein